MQIAQGHQEGHLQSWDITQSLWIPNPKKRDWIRKLNDLWQVTVYLWASQSRVVCKISLDTHLL